MAGVLGHASFERGDPPGLLFDNGKQMNDQLAHDEGGLFLTGGIQANLRWQGDRSGHRAPSCHAELAA
jgi:hypothetical protein